MMSKASVGVDLRKVFVILIMVLSQINKYVVGYTIIRFVSTAH